MKLDAVQNAIYQRLITNGDFIALGVSLRTDISQPDFPEDDDAFPFVTFGPSMGSAWDTKTDFGATASPQIDVWSRAHNFDEVNNVLNVIRRALHYQSLSIHGACHVSTQVTAMQSMRDPDGQTKHGVVQLSVVYDHI